MVETEVRDRNNVAKSASLVDPEVGHATLDAEGGESEGGGGFHGE